MSVNGGCLNISPSVLIERKRVKEMEHPLPIYSINPPLKSLYDFGTYLRIIKQLVKEDNKTPGVEPVDIYL